MAVKNIMVVDDSATDMHLLTEILKKNGYLVITASSGEEAIAKCKKEKPDAVLMDSEGVNWGYDATGKRLYSKSEHSPRTDLMSEKQNQESWDVSIQSQPEFDESGTLASAWVDGEWVPLKNL